MSEGHTTRKITFTHMHTIHFFMFKLSLYPEILTWKKDGGNLILDTRISIGLSSFVHVSRSRYPPWILKRGGLESSGKRLITLNSNTKIRAFFSQQLKIFSFQIFGKTVILHDFFSDFFHIFIDLYFFFV